MDDPRQQERKRVLSPIDRISEVIFGLIMVLTFTCTLGAATAGQEEVRTMLIGALGCNLAWGLIDGVMYLVARVTERGRGSAVLHFIRTSDDHAAARLLIARTLPPVVADVMDDEQLEAVRRRLREAHIQPAARLDAPAWLGALAIFLIGSFSMLPVAVPFMFMESATVALRVSNLIAIVMMFVCGYRLGQVANRSPILMGLGMSALGIALVGVAIALGG